MGKSIRVSNGKETLEIQDSDLQYALKDGYYPTERVIVANSKTKETYEIDPHDLPNAMQDGFSFMDVKKKSGGSVSSTGSKPSSQKNVSSINDLKGSDATSYYKEQKQSYEQAQMPQQEDDPIGNVVRKTAVRKQEIKQQHGGRDATYVAGNYKGISNEIDQINKEERAANNYRFDQTADAKGVLQKIAGNVDDLTDEQVAALDVKDNLTYQRAKEQVLDQRTINKLLSSNSTFESAAVQFGAIKNPLIAKQIEAQGGNLFASKSQKGALVADFLQQPAAKEWAQQSQENMNAFRAAQNNFMSNYPDLAASQLATILSKEREKRKLNNGLLNSVSNEEMDAIVADMVAKGDLTQQQRVVYEKLLRPQTKGLRNPYQTPGFFENLPNATKESIKGMARSVEEGVDMITPGDFVDEAVATKQDIEKDYTHVDFQPKGLWHEFSSATATLTPQVLLMGTGIKGLQAINLIKNPAVSGALMEGMQSFGSNVAQARTQFPNEPVKQMAHATLTTAFEMAMSRIFPDEKVVEGIGKAFKGKTAGVIADFAEGKITAAAAKDLLQSDVQRILTETIPQFVGKTFTNTQKEALEEVVPQVLSDVLTDVFEGKPIEERQIWANAFDTWKQTTLGSGVISGLAAHADTPPLMRSMIYDMAQNADAIRSNVQDAVILENLNAAHGIVQDLEKTNLTQKQKEKVLLQELHQNILQRQLKETTANFAKEQLKEQINSSKETVAKVMETRAEQIAAKEEKQVDENQETQTEVPQIQTEPVQPQQVNAQQEAPPPLSEQELSQMQPEDISEPQNTQNERQEKRQEGLLEPYTTKNGKYTISIENGQRVIKDKDGNSPSEKTARTYLNEHAESLNYNQGQTVEQKGVEPPQFSSQEEGGKWIVENSDNPSEIADLYIKTEKQPTAINSKEQAILTGIDSGIALKTTEDSYRRFGDANNQNNSKARFYFDNKGGRSMDEIAREISDHTGVEVTPQDVADFIDRFPSGDYQARRMSDTEVHTTAKQRFEQLTGVPLTDKIATLAANQLYSPQAIAEAEQVVDSEPLPEAELLNWLTEEVNNIYDEENTNLEYESAQNTTTNTEQPTDETNVGQNTGTQAGRSAEEPAQQGGTETTSGEGKVKKKKILTERAYEGQLRDEVKKYLEAKGLTRDKFSQEERSQQAKSFIDQFGEDAAFEAVKNFDVRGAMASSILANLTIRNNRAMAALEATDTEQLDALAKRSADITEVMEREGYFGGEYIGQLGYEYRDSELGFNSEKLTKKWKEKYGEEPTEERVKEWKKNDKIYAELSQKIEEAEKRAAEAEQKAKDLAEKFLMEDLKEDAAKAKQPARESKQYAQKALNAIGKVRAKIKANNYSDATGMVALVDTGLAVIESAIKGGMHITAAIEKGIKHIKSKLKEQGVETWEKEDAFRKDVTQAFTEAGIVPDKAEMKKGRLHIPKTLIRNLVEDGVKDIEELTQIIHGIVRTDFPDVTHRQVRDAITGYGKTVTLNEDEVNRQIRKMNRIGRAITALEDIAEKKRPLRSGLQRDKLDSDERKWEKELREAMKELPMDEETEAKELKTALDAAKQRLQNQIEDLQREIDTKERVEKSKRSLPEDDKLRELKEQRDELKKVHDSIFGEKPLSDGEKKINALQRELDRITTGAFSEGKKQRSYTSEEQQQIDDLKEQIFEAKRVSGLKPSKRTEEQIKLDALDKAIEEIEKKIRENDLAINNRSKSDTTAVEAKKSALKEAKETLRNAREQAGVLEQKRLESAKKRINARMGEMQRRMKAWDFAKKEPKPLKPDAELIKLKAEKIRMDEDYEKEFYKYELSKRKLPEKIKDWGWETWGIFRVFQATFDLSFALVQGGTMTFSYTLRKPKVVLDAIVNSAKFFGSVSKPEVWLREEVKAQDWYPIAKEAKLSITMPSGKISAKEENFFIGWANLIWDKIVSNALSVGYKPAHDWINRKNPIAALERAAVGYLDTFRVARFKEGMKMLEMKKDLALREGETFEITKQHYKDVADVINTFTGRASLGPLEQHAETLSKALFSPRNWASLLKMTPPYGFVYFSRLSPTARKIYLLDLGRAVGFTAVLMAAATAYYNNDDDENTGVELDPRSSDFGKIRLGKIRVDMWGGKVQQITMLSRFIMGLIGLFTDVGAYKDKKGDLLPLGVPNKSPNIAEIGGRTVTNKLSPTAGMALKIATLRKKKEHGEWVSYSTMGDDIGERYDVPKELLDHVTPIYLGTVKDLLKDDPTAMDGFLAFYALLGGGVNVYGEKKKDKGGSQVVWK